MQHNQVTCAPRTRGAQAVLAATAATLRLERTWHNQPSLAQGSMPNHPSRQVLLTAAIKNIAASLETCIFPPVNAFFLPFSHFRSSPI